MNCLRYFANANPTSVISATPDAVPPKDGGPPLIDAGMKAELTFPNNITASMLCHLRHPPLYKFLPKFPDITLKVICEGGELKLFNFALPHFYHYIEVVTKSSRGSKKRVEKVYKSTEAGAKGEEWWST